MSTTYEPVAPSHAGRLALYNFVDVIEEIANGEDNAAEVLMWADEYAKDIVRAVTGTPLASLAEVLRETIEREVW